MNVRRWLQTLWWMETRCCNTVFCLTVLHNEAKARKWWFFQEACKLHQYAKSQTQYVDRSHIGNPPKPSKVKEAEADWDCQAAKQAPIVLLEATQDRSTSESAKSLLQKQIKQDLNSWAEWTKKNRCSVHWFVALQQLKFLCRLVHLSG